MVSQLQFEEEWKDEQLDAPKHFKTIGSVKIDHHSNQTFGWESLLNEMQAEIASKITNQTIQELNVKAGKLMKRIRPGDYVAIQL